MASKEFVSEAYLAYFGRPADPAGLAFWEKASEAEIVAGFSVSAESQALYGTTFGYEQINLIYQMLFNHGADKGGMDFYFDEVNSGRMSSAEAAIKILQGALGSDLVIAQNKIDAAFNFTDLLDTPAEYLGYAGYAATQSARNFLGTIGSTPVSTVAIEEAISKAIVTTATGGDFRLTTGLDFGVNFLGTTGEDTFKANVVQNASGAQVNTLGSGDELNGGSGTETDTLDAKITAGAFINGSSGTETMPIQPETVSIEVVNFQAVSAGVTGADTQVYVNAKDMLGVEELSSLYSDADLIIQNLTTKDSNGIARPVDDMTIRMAYTGNADQNWGASDYTVYFDQDYLTSETTRGGSVDVRLMNQDAYDVTNSQATALGIPNSTSAVGPTYISEFSISVDGRVYDLAPYLTVAVDPVVNQLVDYADALEAIEGALLKLKNANPSDALLQTVTAAPGTSFVADIPTDENGIATGPARVGTSILLTIEGTETFSVPTLLLTPVSQTNNGMNLFNKAVRVEVPADTNLAINVALEKVGLAGDGGELIIGSMNKTEANVWDAKHTTVDTTTSGIETFNVTVYGAANKASSLAGLHSTNNNLREVNVVTDAALLGTSFADLTIGNSNTTLVTTLLDVQPATVTSVLTETPSLVNAQALKDVQTFNASGFKGDLTLFAALTSEVTAKYLDEVDDAVNPAADNEAFTYTGGTGNDYINLYLDAANLALPGTATREDMTLTVSGGDGSDEIVTMIGVTTDANDNWYANQHINAGNRIGFGNSVATGQLQLNGGIGNDTIRNIGSGDYAINGDTENDTIYSDNTGVTAKRPLVADVESTSFNADRATWVFNDVGNQAVFNLESQPAVAAITGVVNLNLTVAFKGFEKSVVVGGATAGAMSGVSVNDLTINQAIKDAINNDTVLNKLLIAEDGPGRTLVIRDLIDGVQADGDVAVSLYSTALVGSQIGSTTIHLLSDVQAATLGFGIATGAGLVHSAIDGGRFDSLIGADDLATPNALVGGNSGNTSDSIIVGGAGDDVIVLSTGVNSNEGVGYAAFGNGTDSIVNFVAGNSITLHNTADVISFVDGDDATPAVTVAVSEVFTLNLTGSVGLVPGPIAFADAYFGTTGFAYTPVASNTAAQVATALITAFNLAAGDWTASAGTVAGTVVFTQDAGTEANVALPTISNAAAATIQYDGSGVGMTVTQGTQGAALAPAGAATGEVVTVDFGNADIAGSYTFGGVTVPVLVGETGANIAAAFEAAGLTGWTATNVADTNQVIFTAAAPNLGNIANVTDASFVGANILAPSNGNPSGIDHLDFTSYGVDGVYVGLSLVAGNAPVALGDTYIVLVEGTGDDLGAYTMTEYVEAGALGFAGDTVVGTIGVADFGATQAFSAGNFLI